MRKVNGNIGTMRINNAFNIISLFFALTTFQTINAGDLVKVMDLSGSWKFSIDEKDAWTSVNFNDKGWETLAVPSTWEDQGFYGYNGYGFYRKTIVIPENLKGKTLYLLLGYIDDADVTYINGYKIGSSGSFPPRYNTAYNAKRVYSIPADILNYNGKNIIAVQVYDSYQQGGIVSGEVGIYTSRFDLSLDINLQGKWKFNTGDNLANKELKFNDSDWDELFVPGKWEDQGFRNYDGFAWYRKSFVYNGNYTEEKVVLVLGKIDDVDQVYINGVLVASTGDFSEREYKPVETGDRYRAFRGYYIPVTLLKKNQQNIIAIRVYDSGGEGGIYEGPVGFISQPKYIKYWKERKGIIN